MNDLPVSSPVQDRAFVYAVVRRILRNEDAANDATQDALLLVHRYRNQFRGESAFRTWLYRIAVTTALGALRKAKRSREHVVAGATPLGWAIPDTAADPEQQVAARELADHAADELAKLGERYRSVFALKADDWADRDIADALDISVANVKVRTHRARRHLHEALGAWRDRPSAARTRDVAA
jgi:RNA polymerase sigma-70 factor (ECF subfamily)